MPTIAQSITTNRVSTNANTSAPSTHTNANDGPKATSRHVHCRGSIIESQNVALTKTITTGRDQQVLTRFPT